MTQDIYYVDVASKNTGVVVNYEAIENSIRNIVTTPVGSLPSLPDFGSKLNSFLFKNMDSTIIDVLRSEIFDSILRWEKRVTVKFVDIKPHPEYHSIEIVVYFNLKMDSETASRVLKINIKTP